MLDLWSLVRFLHVVGAVVWLGGQLTVSAPTTCRKRTRDQRSSI